MRTNLLHLTDAQAAHLVPPDSTRQARVHATNCICRADCIVTGWRSIPDIFLGHPGHCCTSHKPTQFSAHLHDVVARRGAVRWETPGLPQSSDAVCSFIDNAHFISTSCLSICLTDTLALPLLCLCLYVLPFHARHVGH